MIQAASDSGNADALVFFLFDLLHTDGEDFIERPLAERKSRLADLLRGVDLPLLYTDHQIGQGPAFYREVCTRALEASCRSGLTRRMCRAIAACGSKPSASIVRIYRRRLDRPRRLAPLCRGGAAGSLR